MFHSGFRTQPQCCLFPDAQAESGAPPLETPTLGHHCLGMGLCPPLGCEPQEGRGGAAPVSTVSTAVSPAPRAGTLGMSGC